MAKPTEFTEKTLDIARNLLIRIAEILDQHQIVYHLEGGTLLGIVRDKDLLPWDHDLDISIPSSEVDKFIKCIPKITSLKFMVKTRYKFYTRHAAYNAAPIRMFKIKDKIFLFISGKICLDIFVKYEHQGYVFWEAKKSIMRVEKKHYESYEEIEYHGKKLKVPNDYKGYLTAKYGDWTIPVKEWNCAKDELTVVSP